MGSQARTGWRDAAIQEIVQGNSVAQAGFGVRLEQVQQPFQLLIAKTFKLFRDVMKMAIGPIFQFVYPCAPGTGMRQAF